MFFPIKTFHFDDPSLRALQVGCCLIHICLIKPILSSKFSWILLFDSTNILLTRSAHKNKAVPNFRCSNPLSQLGCLQGGQQAWRGRPAVGPNSGAACSLQLAHVSRLVPPECLLPVDLEHFPHQAGAPLGTLSGAEWVPSVSLTGFETAPDLWLPWGEKLRESAALVWDTAEPPFLATVLYFIRRVHEWI